MELLNQATTRTLGRAKKKKKSSEPVQHLLYLPTCAWCVGRRSEEGGESSHGRGVEIFGPNVF